MRRIGRSTMVKALLPLLTIWAIPASADTKATDPVKAERPEAQRSGAEARVHELTGGNWFDGEKFVPRTVYRASRK